MIETTEIEVLGKKDTRSGFGEGLLEIGKKNKDVVALCADLTGSLKMNAFENEFPERFFQVGIAEANMMSMAAGMTIGGKIPYTGTFANFSTGRVYDQIRQSIAYSNKNVKICASHAGLTLGEDGATPPARQQRQPGCPQHNSTLGRVHGQRNRRSSRQTQYEPKGAEQLGNRTKPPPISLGETSSRSTKLS